MTALAQRTPGPCDRPEGSAGSAIIMAADLPVAGPRLLATNLAKRSGETNPFRE